jgi:predicted trehalose synthase
MMAEGLANGFAEASLAFSDEVQGSSSCSDIIESAAAGILRANGRFLAELGMAVRRVTDDLADQRGDWGAFGIQTSSVDYAKLADLVAARLAVLQSVPPSGDDITASIDYERLADLVSARLAGGTDT